MTSLAKELLQKQVDVYVSMGLRDNVVSPNYQRWLDLFVRLTEKTDILDVDDKEEELFLVKVYAIAPTRFEQNSARKAIRGIRRYYGARGRNLRKRDVMGRPPHIGEINEIKRLAQKGLKYWQIERITGKRISWISRAVHYVIK